MPSNEGLLESHFVTFIHIFNRGVEILGRILHCRHKGAVSMFLAGN